MRLLQRVDAKREAVVVPHLAVEVDRAAVGVGTTERNRAVSNVFLRGARRSRRRTARSTTTGSLARNSELDAAAGHLVGDRDFLGEPQRVVQPRRCSPIAPQSQALGAAHRRATAYAVGADIQLSSGRKWCSTQKP